jgi:hypothetical protein
MVLAYHLIITAYGFWLPNDERGSWSDYVRAWELFRFGGPATKTSERRSLARKPHDIQKRLELKRHLARPAVEFTGLQARAIARGFANYCERSDLLVYACAILPKHAHLVVARHTCDIEQVERLLKGPATSQLTRENIHPFGDLPYRDGTLPTPWARHQWAVYLNTPADIRRAIAYVNQNPARERCRPQFWGFVAAFA